MDYFIHNPVAWGVGDAARDMLNCLREVDISMRRAWRSKLSKEYKGGGGVGGLAS